MNKIISRIFALVLIFSFLETGALVYAQTLPQQTIPFNQLETLEQQADDVGNAVVSIDIVKDVPVMQVSYEKVLIDPLFEQLGIEFRVPRYTPTDQHVSQKVGAGTGFIFTHDGYIITNNHVVSDTEATYVVELSDGTRKSAEVLYKDSLQDIALLKIDGTYSSIAHLGDSSGLSGNQLIASIGNVNGTNTIVYSPGLVLGFNKIVVASATGSEAAEELHGLVQTNAPITEGFSGGPLIDASGNVVGVNVAKDKYSRASFAIPINDVKSVIASYNIALLNQ